MQGLRKKSMILGAEIGLLAYGIILLIRGRYRFGNGAVIALMLMVKTFFKQQQVNSAAGGL
jgi:hypothetical protein